MRNASPYILLTVVGLGVFETALDQTVVVTALPFILPEMRVPPTELDRGAWIVTGYLLGYTAAMPLLGRVADVHGHRRIFLLSLFVHAGGSALVAVAPDLQMLIAARLLQAVGGGATVPIALALAADALPLGRRGVALGSIAAAAETGSVLGPLWGGLVLQALDWRWIFWINIPLALIVAIPLLLLRPPDVRTAPAVDYVGGLLLVLGLASLSTGLAGSLPGGTPVPSAWLVVLASAFTVLFVLRSMRVRDPLVPLAFFRRLAFSSANVAHLLLGGALIIAMVTIPLMANTVLGKDALEGGLRLMRLTAAIPVGAVMGGLLTQRVGHTPPALLGFALSAIGFYWMSGWTLEVADPMMTVHLATVGFGFGLVLAPIATAIMDSVPEEGRGVAAALVTSMRLVGMLIGLAALSSWGTGRFDILTAQVASPFPQAGDSLVELQRRVLEYQTQVTQAAMALFQDFFRVSMSLALIALLPALGLGWRKRVRRPRESHDRP